MENGLWSRVLSTEDVGRVGQMTKDQGRKFRNREVGTRRSL